MKGRVRRLLNDLSVLPTDGVPEGSSFAAGQIMHELVKVCAYFLYYSFRVQYGKKKCENCCTIVSSGSLMDYVPSDGEELFFVFFSHFRYL